VGQQVETSRKETHTMKRAFLLTDDGHLVSALVPISTRNVLNIGDRITASRPLDLGYAAQIKAGERGTVDHIDAPTGTVEVLMDSYHRGLTEWFNHIWLEPYGTEDIIGGIMLLHSAAEVLRHIA
jgi:hypothetical protein